MSRNELGLLGNREFNFNVKLRSEYENWRSFRQNSNENYFILPKELEDYLPSISTRAINLYLLYCFKADNKTGTSYPSVDYCSETLKVSSRSIDSWNSILVNLGLIYRSAETSRSKTTYLLPISDYYYIEEDISPLEYIKKFNEHKDINLKVDGNLTHILHLNQWEETGSAHDIHSRNAIALVYKRSYTDQELNQTFTIFKTILFLNINTEYKEYEINLESDDLEQNFYQFDSPIPDDIFSMPVMGIAINNRVIEQQENRRDRSFAVNIFEKNSKELNNVLSVLNSSYARLNEELPDINE